MCSDFNHGFENANGWYFTNVNGTLFFSANDGTHGSELVKADDLQPHVASTTFSATYITSGELDVNSFDADDIIVRRVGFPNYERRVLEIVAMSHSTVGIATVTYRVAAPGVWDSTDNGTYEIVLQANQVYDINGLAAGVKLLGSFEVNIPDPHVFFVNTTRGYAGRESRRRLGLRRERPNQLTSGDHGGKRLSAVPDDRDPHGTYRLTRSGAGEDGASTGDLDITDDLVFMGAGATTIIDGGGLDRVFDLAAGTRVELSDLVIQGGAGVDQGGGMRIVDATATLNRVTFAGNSAVKEGGGIYSDGYLTVTDSLFSNNLTTSSVGGGGGGLYNLRTATVIGTTFVNNLTPGGILGVGGGAGILNADTGTLTVTNSTLSGNQAAQGDGGGINNSGSSILDHVTVSGNGTPNGVGGGAFNDGTPSGPTKFDTSFGANGLGPFELSAVSGLAFDSSGNVYVADAGAHRVQVYDASGNYLKTIGALGVGQGRLNTPQRIAIDSNNRLLVAESGNNRLQVFNADGSFAFVISGVTSSVATDSANRIYIGRNGQVDVYDANGVLQPSLSFSSQAARPFGVVSGLYIDGAGNKYLADATNKVVQVYNASNTPVRSLIPSSGAATYVPQDVTVDSVGRVYITDAGNDRLQVFSTSGAFVTTLSSSGTANGQLDGPTAIELTSSGQLRIADGLNHRVQTLSTSGTFVATFGTAVNNVAPRAVAVTAAGKRLSPTRRIIGSKSSTVVASWSASSATLAVVSVSLAVRRVSPSTAKGGSSWPIPGTTACKSSTLMAISCSRLVVLAAAMANSIARQRSRP